MRRTLCLLSLVLCCAGAQAASFDCAKARTFVEQQICTDPTLGKLDEAMASNYQSMLDADTGKSVVDMQAAQKRWLASRNKCQTTQCLTASYRKRVNDTCNYGVRSGTHPECVAGNDIQ